MTTVVVAGLVVMVAWCVGALVLAAGVGRAFARRTEAAPITGSAGDGAACGPLLVIEKIQ